jgi:zinc transporter
VTLITGIFGMNVGGLPWLEDNHGFASVMFLMALALVVSLTVIFRTRPQ